ncbi:MAG: amidohydrolase family protein [Planctomycetota bacterium]|nr:amidohydrolase family protein [Planctomycetota bacterium]
MTAQEGGAQEQGARPERARPESAPARAAAQDPRGGRRRFGGRRRGLTVIEAGVVHPVSGPPIENGVVVIRGERILAVGQQGDLQLPENTQVFRFPTGHVYPGLIDASTDAFTDAGLRGDGAHNGGSELSEALVWTGDRDDMLVQHGITTAYVNVRTGAQVRGQGAVVRPRADGFELWEDKEQAALQLRMATGAGAQHPLQRQAQLAAADKLFSGLEDYRDALEKFDKDLEKYNEEFEKYLEHHRKKNGKATPEADKTKKADEAKPTEGGEKPEGGEAPEGRRRGRGAGGRRRPPQGGGGEGGERAALDAAAVEQAVATMMALVGEAREPAAQDPRRGRRPGGGAPAAAPQGKPEAGKQADGDKKADGPKRPMYPKKPKADPQKDALAKVIDGVMPLRIEAQRVEELRAALRLQRENDVPLIVLEHAYAAGEVADEIAEQGATVVLTNVMPSALGAPTDKRNPFAKYDVTALPRRLDEAGVPFAIASGRARLAGALSMMGAAAVGSGCSPEAALRALTLTPAEILGVAEDTGSLSRDKFADVLVTEGPLFASDCRVLLVLSKGRTEFESK